MVGVGVRCVVFAFVFVVGCDESGSDYVEGTDPGDCFDGVDNDADGLIDCAERRCADACRLDAASGDAAPLLDTGVDAATGDAALGDGGDLSDGGVDACPGCADAGEDASSDAAVEIDDRIIVCGGPYALVLRESRLDEGADGAIFQWRASERSEMPSRFRDLLANLDECKPFADGSVGVSGNAGGVALFNYPSGEVTFWADVRNAHSVELLPEGLVAVAAANDHARLVLFDRSRPDERLDEDAFPAAHGLVWDEPRGLLWAHGHDELRTYRIAGRRLERVDTYELPDRGAHDLRPVGADQLVLSTCCDGWFFDRATEGFTIHAQLAETRLLKAIDVHPMTGRTVYVQASAGTYWAPLFSLLDPTEDVAMPDHRLYKARWIAGLLPAE